MSTYGVNNQYNASSIYGSIVDSTNRVTGTGSDVSMGDFLTLMVAQLQNQTIDNQVDDSQFMTQMAQFSQLQLMQELMQTVTNSMSMSYLGKYAMASYTEVVWTTGTNGIEVPEYVNHASTGLVTSVDMRNGKVFVEIDGQWYDASYVSRISTDPIEGAASESSETQKTENTGSTDGTENTGVTDNTGDTGTPEA